MSESWLSIISSFLAFITALIYLLDRIVVPVAQKTQLAPNVKGPQKEPQKNDPPQKPPEKQKKKVKLDPF
jgi:hypothetical protein